MSLPPYPQPQNPHEEPTGTFDNGFFIPHPDEVARAEQMPSNLPPQSDGSATPEWYHEPCSLDHLNPTAIQTGVSHPISQNSQDQSGNGSASVDEIGEKTQEVFTSLREPLEAMPTDDFKRKSLSAKLKKCFKSAADSMRSLLGCSSQKRSMGYLPVSSASDSETHQLPPLSRCHDQTDVEADETKDTQLSTQSEVTITRVASRYTRPQAPYLVSLGAELSTLVTRWWAFDEAEVLGASDCAGESGHLTIGEEQPLLASQSTAPVSSPEPESVSRESTRYWSVDTSWLELDEN